MTFELEHEFGDMVYLKHCPEQKPYMIVGIQASKDFFFYSLCRGTTVVNAYSFELSKEEDTLLKIKSYGDSDV